MGRRERRRGWPGLWVSISFGFRLRKDFGVQDRNRRPVRVPQCLNGQHGESWNVFGGSKGPEGGDASEGNFASVVKPRDGEDGLRPLVDEDGLANAYAQSQ